MSTRQITQLSIITFRPDLSPPYSSPSPPAAFVDVTAKLQAVPGVCASYLGHQLEDPRKWVWIVRWATGAALDAFLASPSYKRWLNSLRAVTDSYASARAHLHGDITASLTSPCTEIVTAYDTNPAFVQDCLRPFARVVEQSQMPGCRALSYGHWQPVIYDGISPPVGQSAGLLIGWESKEARIAQCGQGTPIDRSIHLIYDKCKTLGVYHVKFTRL